VINMLDRKILRSLATDADWYCMDRFDTPDERTACRIGVHKLKDMIENVI